MRAKFHGRGHWSKTVVTLVYLFKMHCDLHSFILKDTTVINSFILGHDSHNIHSSDFILRHPLYFDNDLGCIGQGRVEPTMLRMVRGGHLQTTKILPLNI